MSSYIVEAKSIKDLRSLANDLKKSLKLEDRLWIPIVRLLDILPEVFDKFSYEIVSDDELRGGAHAETDIYTGHIQIKESVYDRACDGEGRDRMTIAHEIGHFFTLCFCGFKFQRNFDNNPIPAYCDPEWQAKCFAGEFMINYDLTKGMTAEQIMAECGVSYDAAKYRVNRKK